MQFKNKLLSGVFASAAIFGMTGTANAVEINVKIGTTTPIDLGDTTDDANPPLEFADEVASVDGTTVATNNTRDEGFAQITFDVSTGTFPSGNVIMQLQLNGATWKTALSGTDFDFSGCSGSGSAATANVSTGGGAGGNTVTFLLSNLNDCLDGDDPSVLLDFDLNGPTQDASLTMTILTESGTVPVDNTNGLVIPLIEMVSAFDVAYNDNGDVTADVQSTLGPYLEFTTGGSASLGDVEVEVDTGVYVSLGASPSTAAAANVSSASVVVTGNFSSFTPAEGGSAEFDASAATINAAGTTATLRYGAGIIANLVNATETFTVTADLVTPIAKSTYSVATAVDLAGTGFTDFSVSGAFSPIGRNGSSAVLPWTASNTQAGGTGSNNFVRVSNPTSLDYGPIFATVLAASTAGAATVGDTVTLASSLAAGGEVVFSAKDIEDLLGNFGRADIEISVEGTEAIIARLVQRTDGTYEINNR
jgi:hypothetical protein